MYTSCMSRFACFLLSMQLWVPPVFAASLTEVDDFDDNPGNISMYQYVPENMPANAPLVVSLHGCRQDAETYSKAGWIQLAEQWKFYLIFPEQKRFNNPYQCWNWFQAAETTRGEGEVQSIIEMVKKMKADHAIDTNRVYVEGLSAGAFLTTVLLASYPDVFAGGATHAGGPAFCAHTERYFWDVFRWWNYYRAREDAHSCMEGVDKTPEQWRKLVEEYGATPEGSWPIISIWQGDADEAVNKRNQQEIIDQWTALHGTDQVADRETRLGANGAILLQEYHNAAGKTVVQSFLIPNLEHGLAIAPGQSCGEESDYILDVGICAARMIGHFWGLQ